MDEVVEKSMLAVAQAIRAGVFFGLTAETAYLAGTKPQFTAEQLRPIIRRLDERCRDLEF